MSDSSPALSPSELSRYSRHILLDQIGVEDNYYRSTVRMKEIMSPNQLIQDLTRITEVHSFVEKIPTMGEIFITLVKGGNHE